MLRSILTYDIFQWSIQLTEHTNGQFYQIENFSHTAIEGDQATLLQNQTEIPLKLLLCLGLNFMSHLTTLYQSRGYVLI